MGLKHGKLIISGTELKEFENSGSLIQAITCNFGNDEESLAKLGKLLKLKLLFVKGNNQFLTNCRNCRVIINAAQQKYIISSKHALLDVINSAIDSVIGEAHHQLIAKIASPAKDEILLGYIGRQELFYYHEYGSCSLKNSNILWMEKPIIIHPLLKESIACIVIGLNIVVLPVVEQLMRSKWVFNLIGGVHPLSKDPVPFKIIAFDKERFCLVNGKGKKLLSIFTMRWTEPGSRENFIEFLRRKSDRWNNAAELLLEHYKVQFHYVTQKDVCGMDCVASFLGQGKGGRIYAVRETEHPSNVYAMKIGMDYYKDDEEINWNLWEGPVDCEDKVEKLLKEYEFLCEAHARCPRHVIQVVTGSLLKAITKDTYIPFAAYLMNCIGERVSYEKIEKDPQEALEILKAMVELHEANIVHGSCRLDNIVKYCGSYYWIDLRLQSKTMSVMRGEENIEGYECGQDLHTLLKSMKKSENINFEDCYARTFNSRTLKRPHRSRMRLMKKIVARFWK